MSNKDTLSNRIETYILKRTGTTLEQLEGVVVSAGHTLDELYTALETIHKNKEIRRTVSKGDIVYSKAPEPKLPGSHLSWVRHNYPPMNESNNGSGIEADFSYLFLTPDEMKQYKAEASGRPAYMLKSKYGKRK